MLALKDIVTKYLELAGDYGRPVPLAAFGWSREETERTFSALEEDYHIGRFLAFSRQPSAASHQPSAISSQRSAASQEGASGSNAAEFNINGFPQTHIAVNAEIRQVL